MSDAALSLQAIRAKLQQLQMQQQQGTRTSNSHTNSVVTPSSLQTSGAHKAADLTDKNTSTSLQLTEKSRLTTDSQKPHFTGASVLLQQQAKGTCRANSTPALPPAPSSTLLAPSSTQLPGSGLNRTADLSDRNLSFTLHTAENTATFEVEGTQDKFTSATVYLS